MKTSHEKARIKSKEVCIATILLLMMFFVCFFASSCTAKEKEVTLRNYKTFITIKSVGLGGAGGDTSMILITDVRISRNTGVELDDVMITYIFRANEASQTFSHSLDRLMNEYRQDVHLTIRWSAEMSLLDVDVSIEVTEISGTILSQPSKTDSTGLIAAVMFLVLAIALLLFFIIRAVVFSKKVNSIKCGMSYNEVLQLLGEPKTSKTTEDITTCIWSRFVIRGVFKNYIIIFKNDKVLSIDGHTNI